MAIHDQIFNMIARNPGVSRDEIIENCINKEYAATFLQDLINENKVKCVREQRPPAYYIIDEAE